MLKKNHCDRQASRLRLQRTLLQKTLSLPASEKVRQYPVYWWWLCNYLNFLPRHDKVWLLMGCTTWTWSINKRYGLPCRIKKSRNVNGPSMTKTTQNKQQEVSKVSHVLCVYPFCCLLAEPNMHLLVTKHCGCVVFAVPIWWCIKSIIHFFGSLYAKVW